MADCNVSIDQKRLPGVKEVCKDFAVLEDHCLAYNLQEQEIESHLASNVHKNRLVQKDLQVAKRLQEEEDERAKVQSQKQHDYIERQDNEIAQEIQEELVRQAERQRLMEEEDAAIARKLQEKEKIRDERRRQKQLEATSKDDYYEDHGAPRPLDVDKFTCQKTRSLDAYSPGRSHHDHSPDYYSAEPKWSWYPKQDSAAPRGPSRYPEHHSVGERGRSRHADPYPEHLHPRGKHEDRCPEFEPSHTARVRDEDREVRKKERPGRPPPPKTAVERDRHDRERDHNLDKHVDRDYRRDKELDLWPAREREKSRDRFPSGDRLGERDGVRQKDRERRQARSRDRGFEEEPGRRREQLRESRDSWEDEEVGGKRRARSQQRVHSNPVDAFDGFMNDRGGGDSRELWESLQGDALGREHTETGHLVHRGSGSVIAETAYGLNEATRELIKLDLREQELKDMEVARKLQQEELKAINLQARAAQMAKDEELARRMMERDKKEYRKNREREKEKEKERERMAMERMAVNRRRPEGNYRPNSEEVVRPRTRDEYEYHRQRNGNNSARSPQPHHDYENVNPSYGYPEHLGVSHPSTRHEVPYKGAYHKR
nr:coiled-coil domain-containing protein 50 [Nothobranchius furzeri]